MEESALARIIPPQRRTLWSRQTGCHEQISFEGRRADVILNLQTIFVTERGVEMTLVWNGVLRELKLEKLNSTLHFILFGGQLNWPGLALAKLDILCAPIAFYYVQFLEAYG